MKATVFHRDRKRDYFTAERCHINELSNTVIDPAESIAEARVEPGITTQWHALQGTVERYVILEGEALVEVGELPPTKVGPGAVALIPAGCRQRITNIGTQDLVFLAICSPRFVPQHYLNLESAQASE